MDCAAHWWYAPQAKDFYMSFLERVQSEYVAERVKDGIFGAMMDVSLINDVSAPFITHQAVSREQRVHVC